SVTDHSLEFITKALVVDQDVDLIWNITLVGTRFFAFCGFDFFCRFYRRIRSITTISFYRTGGASRLIFLIFLGFQYIADGLCGCLGWLLHLIVSPDPGA